jgi:hypothetical protein
LIVASTCPLASIGARAPGSTLSSLTFSGSTPLAASTRGQVTFEEENGAVATVLPATSLIVAIPLPATAKIASGWSV